MKTPTTAVIDGTEYVTMQDYKTLKRELRKLRMRYGETAGQLQALLSAKDRFSSRA